jgi:hypothetical protein
MVTEEDPGSCANGVCVHDTECGRGWAWGRRLVPCLWGLQNTGLRRGHSEWGDWPSASSLRSPLCSEQWCSSAWMWKDENWSASLGSPSLGSPWQSQAQRTRSRYQRRKTNSEQREKPRGWARRWKGCGSLGMEATAPKSGGGAPPAGYKAVMHAAEPGQSQVGQVEEECQPCLVPPRAKTKSPRPESTHTHTHTHTHARTHARLGGFQENP